MENQLAKDDRNRRIRNRTYGGVGGRREQSRLLPDRIYLFSVKRKVSEIDQLAKPIIEGADAKSSEVAVLEVRKAVFELKEKIINNNTVLPLVSIKYSPSILLVAVVILQFRSYAATGNFSKPIVIRLALVRQTAQLWKLMQAIGDSTLAKCQKTHYVSDTRSTP